MVSFDGNNNKYILTKVTQVIHNIIYLYQTNGWIRFVQNLSLENVKELGFRVRVSNTTKPKTKQTETVFHQ